MFGQRHHSKKITLSKLQSMEVEKSWFVAAAPGPHTIINPTITGCLGKMENICNKKITTEAELNPVI